MRLLPQLLFCSIGLLASAPAIASTAQPNIVIILADDLGNADVGYHGSDIRTPNIDKLAKEGVRLESFHSLPMCTPSRAALMTGRYPMRMGLQTLVIFPKNRYGLPTDEWTLPQALKQAGYETKMIGKWHLGHADKKYWPQNRGFDHFYGNLVGDVSNVGVIDWHRDAQFIQEKQHFMTLAGNEAVNIIGNQSQAKPFFLYFAALSVHVLNQTTKMEDARYATTIKDPARRTYAATITGLDEQVGRIVSALEKRGLRDNTLIIFASDNGGTGSGLANNSPYRGHKGSLYEGGVRVPAIFNWPGKLQPSIVNEPLSITDIMPTVLTLAGAKSNPTKPLDGKDIWPTIAKGQATPREDFLINVEAFRGAIIKGKWKLVKLALLPGKTELFDLSVDPGEKNNLAEQNPDVVRDLESRLVAYAKQQKMSEWLKSQQDYIGAKGHTIFDPEFDIDDSGLPTNIN
ncbi:MAG: arylsulfatase [Pseudomonadota bacterium]|nr:arylsulfatase [Pseudomonadota bacterium]